MRSMRLRWALALLIALAPMPLGAQSDLTGTWAVSLVLAEDAAPPAVPLPTIDAEITQTGEKLSFDLTSPFGRLQLEGTVIKNRLAATYQSAVQGQTLEFKLSGLADGDAITGTLEVVGKGEVKWKAVRKPVPSADASKGAPAK